MNEENTYLRKYLSDPLTIQTSDGNYELAPGVELIPGPKGDKGDKGDPGLSSTVFDYIYSNFVTTPPTSGQIRLNNINLNLATKIWINYTTDPGSDAKILISELKNGDNILLQDEGDSSKYQEYLVNGILIDNGTWSEIPVSWIKGGTTLDQKHVFIFIRAKGDVVLLSNEVAEILNELTIDEVRNLVQFIKRGFK